MHLRFVYKDTTRIDESAILKVSGRLEDYTRALKGIVEAGGYDAPESSLNVPSDNGMRERVHALADETREEKPRYVIVAGIGGSNLGTMAVYDALRGKFSGLDEYYPKLLFVDTVDASSVNDACSLIGKLDSREEVVLNVISKSGTTTETIANFEVLYRALKERFDEIDDRVVATTDKGSKLWNAARERGFSVLEIPQQVGGRFSVLTPVGLFPLALAGIDIEALADGAREMREHAVNDDVLSNPSMISAVLLYIHAQNGFVINDNFYFVPALESLGKWYRQLMGESIGKEYNEQGERVEAGITPSVSVGSADLHSVAQLYLGGPKNKYTHFISSAQKKKHVMVPGEGKQVFPELVKGIAGKPLEEIMDAILEGVKTAYANKEMPFAEVVLDDISETSIGSYLQWKMAEMMYLGKLFEVNAFDQPNVEEYKKVTRKLLES